MRVQLVLKDGSILSHADYTEWNKQNWFIKLLGYFFKSIKKKYVKIEGFKCELTPRFIPGQKVWFVHKGQITATEIISIQWDDSEIEYTTDGMNDLGHQLYGHHIDTKDLKCLLFDSKEKCEEFYKNIINENT